MKWPRAILRDEAGAGEGAAGEGAPVPLPPPTPNPLEGQVAAMQGDIAKLRDALQARVMPPPPQPPLQPMQQGDPKQQLEAAFWKDPLAVSAAIAQRATQEAMATHGQLGLDTLVETAKQQARGSDPERQKLFDAYSAEIEEVVRAMPPQLQANKAVWENARNVVLGRHVDDIRKLSAPTPAPTGLTGGPLPPSSKAPKEPEKTPLSADEKDWAKRWGLTEDQYRHGKQLYDNQETAFDTVITFDSTEARRRKRAEAERRRPAA